MFEFILVTTLGGIALWGFIYETQKHKGYQPMYMGKVKDKLIQDEECAEWRCPQTTHDLIVTLESRMIDDLKWSPLNKECEKDLTELLKALRKARRYY